MTLRLPPDVVEGYRSGGPGWQIRMGEVLAAGLKPRPRAAAARTAAGAGHRRSDKPAGP